MTTHLNTPYEQFFCDIYNRKYTDEDSVAESLKDLDCPDCIEMVWEVLLEAMGG